MKVMGKDQTGKSLNHLRHRNYVHQEEKVWVIKCVTLSYLLCDNNISFQPTQTQTMIY